jgi:hypothetical protein
LVIIAAIVQGIMYGTALCHLALIIKALEHDDHYTSSIIAPRLRNRRHSQRVKLLQSVLSAI